VVAKALFFVFVAAVAVDAALLFKTREGIFARRAMADKLSNGDENEIRILLENLRQILDNRNPRRSTRPGGQVSTSTFLDALCQLGRTMRRRAIVALRANS